MKRWHRECATIAAVLVLGACGPVSAQDIDYGDPAQFDRQPPPPPPPSDRDYGPGYYRAAPPDYRSGRSYRLVRRAMVCRTPEGECFARGPQVYRDRCGCDFGDGWVRGRIRP